MGLLESPKEKRCISLMVSKNTVYSYFELAPGDLFSGIAPLITCMIKVCVSPVSPGQTIVVNDGHHCDPQQYDLATPPLRGGI